jgi:hypothetical protein
MSDRFHVTTLKVAPSMIQKRPLNHQGRENIFQRPLGGSNPKYRTNVILNYRHDSSHNDIL